jgi:Mg/Co/Ni transporter MgtE
MTPTRDLAELARDSALSLGHLISQHIKVARLEIAAEARAMGRRAIVVAVLAILIAIGYAVAIAGLGVTIAVLEAILAYFSKGVGMDVLLVVGSSMLVCTALGGIIGALLPFAARRIGTDPATLSSPMITSIMDLIGVFIYFGFAYLFLGDLLVAAA